MKVVPTKGSGKIMLKTMVAMVTLWRPRVKTYITLKSCLSWTKRTI